MTAGEILKGKWLGHPLHPIFVHVPVGLWPAALIFDLLSRLGGGANSLVRLSFFCIAFGLLTALLAVPTGLADWSGIKKEKPAWKIGLWHMALNLLTAAIFAVNLGLRVSVFQKAESVSSTALVLSAVGVFVLCASTYLGGLMVYNYGTSVARFSKGRWRAIAERGGARLPAKEEKKS